MRILASNPDNLGDLVLRQPMYDALRADGHELVLITRSFAAPLARLVSPGASILELRSNPYSSDFRTDADDVRRIVDAARDFAPEVFCIAPYQRTQFEELLARSLDRCRVVGMNGILYRGESDAGLNIESSFRYDHAVEVAEGVHELQKNELLTAALLGRPVKLQRPKIEPGDAEMHGAVALLEQLDLKRGDFWVCGVGHNQYTALRNWSPANWAGLLSHAVNRYDRKCLFIGTPDEHDVTEETRKLMGDKANATASICGAPPSIEITLGLIQLSAGYIGRDTGPMHLAAAMGKPIIAVFGGGTWPRFIPAADCGVALTVSVPCSACDWVCCLRDSHCVKEVPVGEVRNAIDAVEGGTIKGMVIRQLQPSLALSERMTHEAAESSQEYRRALGAKNHELRILGEKLQRSSYDMECVARANSEKDNLLGVIANLSETLKQSRYDMEKSTQKQEELVARTDSEKKDMLGLISDLCSASHELESVLRTELDRSRSLEKELEMLRLKADSEKSSLLDIVGDLSAWRQELEDKVRTQQTLLQQYETSIVRAVPAVSRRLVAARGRRIAELRSLVREAVPVLKRKFGLASNH